MEKNTNDPIGAHRAHTNAARDAHAFAAANLADARKASATAAAVLEGTEEPAAVLKARNAVDVAAARVRAAERGETAAGEAFTAAEREQNCAELRMLRAGLDVRREIEELRRLSELAEKMRRDHAAAIDAINAQQAKIVDAHNENHARAVALAGELNEPAPSCPALPSTSVAAAGVLVAFDAAAEASGGARDNAKLLEILAPLFDARPVRHRHYTPNGGELHPDFSAAAQVAALLDGTFAKRSTALRAAAAELQAREAVEGAVESAREAITRAFNKGDEGTVRSTVRDYVAAGMIDHWAADELVAELRIAAANKPTGGILKRGRAMVSAAFGAAGLTNDNNDSPEAA